MSRLGYVTTEGHYTFDPSGFYFDAVINQDTGYYQNYMPYCAAIGGWGATFPNVNTGFNNPNDCKFFRTSGSYLSNHTDPNAIKGTIQSVVLCSMTANSPDVTVTGSASWSTTATKYNNLYVESGASVKFTATPASGYKFLKWKEDYTTTNPKTVTANDDVTYTPIFVPTSYNLIITTGTGGIAPTVYVNGEEKTITDGKVIGVKAGDNVSVMANPDTEYVLSHWVINGFTYYGATQSFTMPEPVSSDYNIYSYYTQRDSLTLSLVKEHPSKGEITLAHETKDFDLTLPIAGAASAPVSPTGNVVTVTYSGASDVGGSGLKHVELWVSKDGGAWSDSLLRGYTAIGSFKYAPTSAGRYAFRVVAEDNDGNRSAAASGAGDCSTLFCDYDLVAATNAVLASNGGVIDSYTQYSTSYPASKLIDGLTASVGYWRSSGSGTQAIVFSFSGGAQRVLSRFALFNDSSYRTKGFTVSVSQLASGDSDWAVILNAELPNSTVNTEFELSSPVVARRVKLTVLSGHSSTTHFNLREFAAYAIPYIAPDLECSLGCTVSAVAAGDAIPFSIKFNRTVSGFTVDDITLNKTGTADGTLADFAGEGDSYTVNVTGVTGVGTLAISVAAEVCADAADAELLNEDSNTAACSVIAPDTEADWTKDITLYVGVEYTFTASVTDTRFDEFLGWYDGDGVRLTDQFEYVFTPADDTDIGITAKFAQKPSYAIESQVTDGSIPYSADNPAAEAGCTVEVRSPDFTNQDKWLAGSIAFTAVPATGWRLLGWNVTDKDTGSGTFQDPSTTGGTSSNPLTFPLSFNALVSARFGKIPYTVTLETDAASTSADAVEEVFAADPDNGDAPHDTEIEIYFGGYVWCCATARAGFLFAGWFDSMGTLVSTKGSTGDPYIFQVTGDITLTAKYTAPVTLTAAHSEAADDTGTVSIDGGASGATATANVIIGETCIVKAHSTEITEEVGSGFDSWYATTAPQVYTTPLAYLAEQTITVSGPVAMTARFVGFTDLEDRYLEIRNYNNNTSQNDPLIGILSATGGTEISKEDYLKFFNDNPYYSLGLEPEEPGDRYYKFSGTKASTLSAISAARLGFMRWDMQHLIPIDPEPASGAHYTYSSVDVLSSSANADFVTNRHYVMTAVWGNPQPVKVSQMYASGCNSSMGSLEMSPATAERSVVQGGISDKYLQGSHVELSATVENGYVFLGWYYDAAGTMLASADLFYTADIPAPSTFYAKFAQDTNAIYKWEGGTERKMLEWRSKRYVSNKPFNPSSAKVYSDAYPVTIRLFASSSPDSPPASKPTVSVDVRKQDGFRLPMARPEKYLEIEVLSTVEVSELAVSTSMEGLAQ